MRDKVLHQLRKDKVTHCALDSPRAHLPESACLPEVLRYTCVWQLFSKMSAGGLAETQCAVIIDGL